MTKKNENTKKEENVKEEKEENIKDEKQAESTEDSQELSEEVCVSAEEIDKIIRNHVYAAMAIGLAPIPVVDLVGLTTTQLDLVRAVAKKYDVPFKKNAVKTVLTALVGGILPVEFAPIFASVIKCIPVVGTLTGAVSMSLLGGASTYAVGRVFVNHFESGGTLLDIDTKKARKGFKEQYEKGKEYVSSLKKKEKTKAEPEKEAKEKTKAEA
jgi:uncharacterized protein (DUF697 family)